MKKNTQEMYAALTQAVAAAFNVTDTSKRFSVDIPQETTLNDRIRESIGFLQAINVAAVTDSKGQALDLGVSGLLAKRTNTATGDRIPTAFGGLDGSKWETHLTEFDVSISYQTLDQWARYKDFYDRYLAQVYRSIALSRIMVGWHGTQAATATNATTYPLGQDVNKGWLKILSEDNASNYMTQSGATADKITIGAAGDYKNVDALAYDLLQGIPLHLRTGNEVVIVGADLIKDNMHKSLNKNAQTPSEKIHGVQVIENTLGGLTAIQVPAFPDKGMVVTDLQNLHLYYQEDRTRRQMKDQSERNRVTDFLSSNDAYAIGNVKAISAIKAENVEFKETESE